LSLALEHSQGFLNGLGNKFFDSIGDVSRIAGTQISVWRIIAVDMFDKETTDFLIAGQISFVYGT
jgi:hypothetical protein